MGQAEGEQPAEAAAEHRFEAAATLFGAAHLHRKAETEQKEKIE